MSETDRRWTMTAPRTGNTFVLAGIMHRQEAITALGEGRHVFTAVREPGNPFDPNAVQIAAGDKLIGYIASAFAAAWSRKLAEYEDHGWVLQVHGTINRRRDVWKVILDTPDPTEWPSPPGRQDMRGVRRQ